MFTDRLVKLIHSSHAGCAFFAGSDGQFGSQRYQLNIAESRTGVLANNLRPRKHVPLDCLLNADAAGALSK